MATLRIPALYLLCLATASGVVANRSAAQTALVTPGSAYTVDGTERWLYPGQIANRTPWRGLSDRAIPLDSISVSASDSSVLFHSHDGDSFGNAWSVARRSRTGAVEQITTRLERTTNSGSASGSSPASMQTELQHAAEMALQFVQLHLLFRGGTTVPSTLHVVVPMPRGAYDVQAQIRTVVVGDSGSGAHRVTTLRDSVRVVLAMTQLSDERTLFGPRTDVFTLSGNAVATRQFDHSCGVSVSLADTTQLSGSETRTLPDGRRYSSTVRFEQRRTVALLDSAALQMRSAQQWRAHGGGVGMLIRPPLGAQPIDGSRADVRDSLVREHAVAATQSRRDSIEDTRRFLSTPGTRERLARTYLASGDTANALRITDLYFNGPVSGWTYQLIRPALNDPAVAMRFGVSANDWYEAFEYNFKYTPMAIATDSLKAFCVPSVCRLIATEWERATEPRLRNVGLMAHYSVDPALWAETVIREADAGVRQLKEMSELAQGMNFITTLDPGIPIPPANAEWQEWLTWLRGGTTETLNRRDSANIAIMGSNGRFLSSRFPMRIASNVNPERTMAMAALRFNVSYRDSVARRLTAANGDSARFVFGTLARWLKLPARSPDALLAALSTSSELDRAMARTEVERLPFAPADSATAAVIEGKLLDRYIDGGDLWPLIDSLPPMPNSATTIRSRDSTFVIADSLTTSSRHRFQQGRDLRFEVLAGTMETAYAFVVGDVAGTLLHQVQRAPLDRDARRIRAVPTSSLQVHAYQPIRRPTTVRPCTCPPAIHPA